MLKKSRGISDERLKVLALKASTFGMMKRLDVQKKIQSVKSAWSVLCADFTSSYPYRGIMKDKQTHNSGDKKQQRKVLANNYLFSLLKLQKILQYKLERVQLTMLQQPKADGVNSEIQSNF